MSGDYEQANYDKTGIKFQLFLMFLCLTKNGTMTVIGMTFSRMTFGKMTRQVNYHPIRVD
jgi:hypothetical protein